MHAVEWAMRRFPIDPSRVTITGMSMGGIGSAAVPLHRPHVFAAAEPLCGYHSYLIRGDVAGRAQRPWERYLAEERSNVLWAENGEHLPALHRARHAGSPRGEQRRPHRALREAQFAVKHEHPEAGHNVWQQTYEDLKGLTWLMNRRVDLHPSHVRFKTTRTRWSTSAWVTVDELAGEGRAGARSTHERTRRRRRSPSPRAASRRSRSRATRSSSAAAPVTVTIDGQRFAFEEGEALVLGRDPAVGRAGSWRKGALAHAGLYKHGAVTGPIRDVFAEPILFVYGDGEEARANEQVARCVREDQAGRPGRLSGDERHRVLREEGAARQRPRALPRRRATTASSARSSARARSRSTSRQAPSRSVASESPARSSAPRSFVRTRCARIATSSSSPAPTCPARSARRPCPICFRTSSSGTSASPPREGRCSSVPDRYVQAGSSRRSGRCRAQLSDPLARASRAPPQARRRSERRRANRPP